MTEAYVFAFAETGCGSAQFIPLNVTRHCHILLKVIVIDLDL
jgi:hypothetical protein